MKHLWQILAFIFVFTTFTGAATETTLIGKDSRNKGKHFPLDQAKLNIELAGPVVLTSWQLRFRNDQTIEAEGELKVPLRSGCHVVGYAMDVSGRMREGVVVDAKRARRAYEEIVRKKVDPGILEKSATGFTTKVYPLPANGSKTVRVDLAEIRSDTVWQPHLPGNNDHATDWVITCHDEKAPQTNGINLTWTRENGVWIARGNHSLKQLAQLKITPSGKAQTWVATEEAGKIRVVGKIPTLETTRKRTTPNRIELWWDGSLAGRKRDREAVIKSLQSLFTWVQKSEISLRVIRDATTHTEEFQVINGHCGALLERLRKEPAEGMARFDQLRLDQKDAMILVISEGLTPLPSSATKFTPHTSWCLLDPTGQGGRTLGRQALSSSNEVRSPADLDWRTVITPGALPPAKKNWSRKRQDNHWIITGEIAQHHLKQLKGGVAKSSAAQSIWAIETHQYMLLNDRPTAELLDFAKREEVLTDQTAFIVLDSINDYVTYEIEPPEDAIRKAWQKKMANKKTKKNDTLAQWTAKWQVWQKKFHQTPPDFGKRLAKALGDTSSLWAKHIGNGKKQIRSEEMIRIVKLQSEVDNLTKSKPSLDRLKGLSNTQTKWEKLRAEVGDRVGILRVTIGGFVHSPGTKELPFGTNLGQAIDHAGGATAFGSIKRVALHRKGSKYVYNLKNETHRSILLHDQDAINMPQKMAFGNGGGKPGAPAPFESASEKGWVKSSLTTATWSPDRPYIKVLDAILEAKGDWKLAYRAQSKVYGWRADYYLDVIELLEQRGLRKEALIIAGNVAQLSVNSPELLRRAARAIDRLGDPNTSKLMFQRITRLTKDEPTSWIDMARWHSKNKDFTKALECYAVVTEQPWASHWHPVWISAMIEVNGLLSQHGKELAKGKVDPTRQTPLTADLRVVLDWDAARSNVDLWVNEPLDNTVGWGNPNSESGGSMPANAIAGYGPEQYIIHHAMPGSYLIQGKFHGDWTHTNKSTVTVEARIILNFGRHNETVRHISLRIPEQKLLELARIKWEITP